MQSDCDIYWFTYLPFELDVPFHLLFLLGHITLLSIHHWLYVISLFVFIFVVSDVLVEVFIDMLHILPYNIPHCHSFDCRKEMVTGGLKIQSPQLHILLWKWDWGWLQLKTHLKKLSHNRNSVQPDKIID